MTMEKNNEEKLIKVVIESYAIRDESGFEEFRAITREGAERELNSLREYYERHSLPFNSRITRERAIVECEVVHKRYSKSYPTFEKAGKTFYILFHGDDRVIELDHEPKPMDLINARAYNVNWTVIE